VEQDPEDEGRFTGLTIAGLLVCVRILGSYVDWIVGREERFSDANVMRVVVPETVHGCTGGTKLWRANPRSGSGMK
jgi:hypothetical protein